MFNCYFSLLCLQSQLAGPPISLLLSLFILLFVLFFVIVFHLKFTFPSSVFNLSLPARRYHCFYAPPARLAANLTAGLCLIYEKDCQHSKLPVSELKMWRRQNARSIYFHSTTRLKWEICTQQICLDNQAGEKDKRIHSIQPEWGMKISSHICYWRTLSTRKWLSTYTYVRESVLVCQKYWDKTSSQALKLR